MPQVDIEKLMGEIRKMFTDIEMEAGTIKESRSALTDLATTMAPADDDFNDQPMMEDDVMSPGRTKRTSPMTPTNDDNNDQPLKDYYVVSHVPSKPQRIHTIKNLCGHCTTWKATCGFKFGRSNVSIVKREMIDACATECDKGCFKIVEASTPVRRQR